MANDKYALLTSEIVKVVSEFNETKDSYDFTLSKEDEGHIIYKVSKGKMKGKMNVTLTFYLLKGGMTSHQIQPAQGLSDLKSVANECWEYVVEKTHIKSIGCNFFKFNGVTQDDLDALISIASVDRSCKVLKEDNPTDKFKSKNIIIDPYGARLTLNYYNTGTLTLQGAISPMFTYVWTDCVNLLGDVEPEEREQFISYSNSDGIIRVDPDLSKHIENLPIIAGSKIDMLAEVSCKLVNLGQVYDDNGWIPFCILRALDALMSKKLQEADVFDNKDHYTKFFYPVSPGRDAYAFHTKYTCFDTRPGLKKALEDGYSFLCVQRNSSFHIDRKNPATSRVVSYEEAVEIVEDTLKLMNRICKNW